MKNTVKEVVLPPGSVISGGELLTPKVALGRAVFFAGPGILWLFLLLILPTTVLFLCSLLTRGSFGQVSLPLTLEHYLRILGYGPFGWTGMYWQILGRSFVIAMVTTAFCLLLAYPLAFFIASHQEQTRNLLLTLVVIPFWTNLVIRTYAWMLILGPDALPAWIASKLGFNPEQAALYPSEGAVYLGMVYTFLPYLVLPLYTAVERIDWTLAEAAQDLYANGPQVFWRVLLPQTFPGLVSGVLLVSISAFGMFVIPDLLGGSKAILVGNVIQQQFGSSLDYPFGAALSFLVTGLTLGVLYAYSRYAGERGLADLV
jgi:spermidine/putrescine transport system permease protein